MRFSRLFLLTVLFYSTFLNAQQITVVSKMPGGYIYVIKSITSGVTGRNTLDTVFIGVDSCTYRKNTEHLLLMVKSEKHRARSFLINDKMVKENKKRIVLDPPQPMPEWTRNDCHIKVDDISFSVNKKDFKTRYYEDYDKYLSNNMDRVASVGEEIKVKNSRLSEDVNNFLLRAKYIDTSRGQRLNLNIYDELEMDLDIRSLTYVMIADYYYIEIKSMVKFSAFFTSDRPLEKEFTVRSEIGRSVGEEYNIGLLNNALENVIIAVLKDPQLAANFVNIEAEVKKKFDAMSVLELGNKALEPSSLENAVNCVVTIKLANGHGSGCIISNDGYVVTNYHVVGNDSSKAEAIFNSGAKVKCTFIRGNPIYDLALLKLDTLGVAPIKIASKPATIGSDAYAIGTPKTLSLGQTVTRGIVSAKRTLQDKVYIQSDVSVNGGNSGGALTNREGELIGIVNAKLIGVGVEGVSFAIPVNYIEEGLKLKILR
jgi:serine protease Do